MTVTNSAQCFNWEEFGFSLHIPDNSLPSNTDKCFLNISANLSAPFETPNNYKLVSAVYRITCEPKVHFQKDLAIKIQHCASSELTNHLQFARKRSPDPGFTFLANGDFSTNSSYGTLLVRQFCWVAVFISLMEWRVQENRYCAVLFHKILLANEVDIALTICYDLLAHIKVKT